MDTERQKEVIARLCAIASNVAKRQFQNDLPADCFCHEKKMIGFQFSDQILDFMEVAVEEHINKKFSDHN